MQKRHIYYKNCKIYAIYYRNADTIYYNLNFNGSVELIILK